MFQNFINLRQCQECSDKEDESNKLTPEEEEKIEEEIRNFWEILNKFQYHSK